LIGGRIDETKGDFWRKRKKNERSKNARTLRRGEGPEGLAETKRAGARRWPGPNKRGKKD